MRETLKKYGGVLYIALMTIAIAVVLSCTNELDQILETLAALHRGWLAATLGCVVAYLFLRMAMMRFYLKCRGHRLSWRSVAGVTGAGQFYSAITPSASGGQPMQVLQLKRLGVPVSLGTACVCVKFLGFQAAFLILGGVLAFGHLPMLSDQLFGFRWLVVLGYLVNAGLLAAVVLTIPRTRIVDTLTRSIIALGAKLRLVKNRERTLERFQGLVRDYRDALIQLLRTPLDAAIMFLFSLLQVLAYMSVPVCLYHALGLTGTRTLVILTLQLQLFVAAAFIPLPGAAGAQESGFCIFFRGIFPEDSIMAAMVCWRFFSYYLLMILGFVMMIAGGSLRRAEKPASPLDFSKP